MIKSFKENKDIYSFIASLAFNTTYEACLENLPTGEYDEDGNEIKVYQPDGKARRSAAKSIVLGILYGRSIPSIADQLYSKEDWDDKKKIAQAQHVYDAVLQAFPALKNFMEYAQHHAHVHGYVETILGRRRHIPDMVLNDYEFEPLPGYVNPDVDPLNISTLEGAEGVPKHIQQKLYKELKSYKYNGQRFKRIRQLAETEHIKVIDNTYKISEASRQCVNCVDYETEILTVNGWRKHDEIQIGDKIISYSQDSKHFVVDKILDIHHYAHDFPTITFENEHISAVSTLGHRWPTPDGELYTHEIFERGSATLLGYSRLSAVPISITADDMHESTTVGVWCVTTLTHTWIARRHGKIYITGNSIIQGSAAELTKMAMIQVETDPIWSELQGQVLIPVHDELIGEVPIENALAAGDRLSQDMCDAASFMPFSIKCDVTTSYRWSGIEYPCAHPRPESLQGMTEEEIKWVQYHIYDIGYYLPIFKLPNGDKPRGEEALGVNGRDTEEFRGFIADYMSRYNLHTDQEFLWHIEHFVCTGVLPNINEYRKKHGGQN